MEDLDELEAHQRAYLQIFQAVLKKKNAPPEQARALLAKLKNYVTTRIKDPDEFLDHIPTFSRGLGVRPEQLSAFIGSNLLPALNAVKKSMRAKQEAELVGAAKARQSGGGGGKVSDAAVASSILKEIERDLGVFMEQPARFAVHDMGLMKLVSLNGGQDVLSTSLRESAGMPADSGGAPAGGGGATVTGKSSGGESSGGGSAGSTPAAAASPGSMLGGAETSIISEILEKFGEGLNVPGRLEVPPFPKNQGAATADGASSAGAAPAGAAPAAGASGSSGTGSSAPASSGGGFPDAPEDEQSMIAEILEKFGDGLKLPPGKLRAGDGMVGGGNEERLVSSIQPGSATAQVEPEPEPEDLPPIPLTFQQYIETVKRIQQFQSTGDSDGYRGWLSGDAGLSGKAVVGLRNLDTKAKRGADLNYDDEYYNIAAHLDVDRSQIRELHDRLKRFERLQRLLNEFTGSIKQGDPALVGAMKKIWPQVRLLFNDEWKADHMMNTLKIPLLQIADPELKQRVIEKMKPLLTKVEQLATA